MNPLKDFQDLLSKTKLKISGSVLNDPKKEIDIRLQDKYNELYDIILRDNGDVIYKNDNIKLGNLYKNPDELALRLQESQLNEINVTGGTGGFTPGSGEGVATKYAFGKSHKQSPIFRGKKKKKNKYKLSSLLNESITYSKFKNEVKTRTKQQQLHRSVKEVQKRLNEINKVLEYTNKMRKELNENGDNIKYSRFTEQALRQIKEMTVNLYKNIKELKK